MYFLFDTGDWGTTFIALNPEILIGVAEFKKRSTELINRLRALSTKDGKPVHIPGYDLEEKIQERLKSGEIEVEDQVLDELKTYHKSMLTT